MSKIEIWAKIENFNFCVRFLFLTKFRFCFGQNFDLQPKFELKWTKILVKKKRVFRNVETFKVRKFGKANADVAFTSNSL